MTEGLATPGAGWRRADGWTGKPNGGPAGKRRRRGGRRGGSGELSRVGAAESPAYYARPIIKPPVWKTPDVPLYLFLGGAAGTSSILGALADVTGRPGLTRVARLGGRGGSPAPGGVLLPPPGPPG